MQKSTGIAMVLSLFFIFSGFTGFSKKVKTSFKVWGNCGMCKEKIEGAVNEVSGVVFCKWNEETKKMVVRFDNAKTSLKIIKSAIATAGYDTEEYRATDEDYQNLHGCCQYKRPEN